MHDKLMLLSLGFGVAAGVLGIWATMTEVSNNQDKFIDDLKRQGQRASIAAVCAAASSILLAVEYFAK